VAWFVLWQLASTGNEHAQTQMLHGQVGSWILPTRQNSKTGNSNSKTTTTKHEKQQQQQQQQQQQLHDIVPVVSLGLDPRYLIAC